MENIIYKSNLEVFEDKYNSIYKYLTDNKNNSLYNIKDVLWDISASEEDVMVINRNGRLYYLNSRYSDEEFAKNWAKQFESDNYKTVYIIFGLSNFRCAKELIKNAGKENAILLYEPDKNIFMKAIEKIDITDVIKNDKVVLCINGINDEVFGEFVAIVMNDYALMRLTKYCCMPNYDELYPEIWRDVIKNIKDKYEMVILSRNTELCMASEFIKNKVITCRDIVREYSIIQLRNEFHKIENIQNIPAIIVSAGPSLDKNINELKQAKGKAFILAVDTALKSLLRRDIIPDLIITIDSHKPPVLFMHPKFKDIPIVVCDCSNYELYVLHQGKRFYFSETDSYMSYIYEKCTGEKLFSTESGGSVANNAFSFANIMGFKKIILVGQDLAYTGKKFHTTDAYGESDKNVLEDYNKYFEVEDIYGGKVYTESNMDLYRKWFESQIVRYPRLDVIDATEGGAKIEGSEIMTLKEAIERECKTDIDFEKIIAELNRPITDEKAEKILQELDNMPNDLLAEKDKLKKYKRKYEKLEELSRKGKVASKEFNKLVEEINKITEYIDKKELLKLANVYEKNTEFEVLGNVYHTKDSVKDEIRDISNNGIKLMDSYIEGIDCLVKDLKEWKSNLGVETEKSLIESLSTIENINNAAKNDDMKTVNDNMKIFYKEIVHCINYMKESNIDEWKNIKDILDEIVEKDSQAKIYEMNDILQNRLCGMIKSLLDRKVYLTEE